MEVDYKMLAGVILVTCGVLAGLWKLVPALWRKVSPWAYPGFSPPASSDKAPMVMDSDAPAPTGVTGYLALVAGTAPKADATTWWGYAGKELTVAQVLTAERDRLGGGP